MECRNSNHSFTNGKHDSICSVSEMADHIAHVRILATTFHDHLENRYTTYVGRTFGFYLSGFDNGSFISECLYMLDMLRSLIELRVTQYCCNYDEDAYDELILFIDTYQEMLNEVDRFDISEIKSMLKQMIDKLLAFYDITLIDTDEDFYESDSDSDSSSITLVSSDGSIHNDVLFSHSGNEEYINEDQSMIR